MAARLCQTTGAVSTETDQLCVDTIRALAMDAIQKANSGHPGLPMGMAPTAYVLFRRIMRHDPQDPAWPDRDRFILSAGHGSMLLYAALHLSGYDMPMDQIKRFRQWESITPGHPEVDRTNVTPGVEVTTGPLGQGFANGVGMAIAERFLRDHYGAEVQDHHIYAIVSDGDLMEGIASEAASLAGQLGLGRLVYLYDDNDISLDGPTSLSFDRESVDRRFEAYGWHVQDVHDANDLVALETAIKHAQKVDRQAVADPRQVDHRLPVAEQGRHEQGPRGGARRRGGRPDQGGHGLGSGQDFYVPDEVYEAFEHGRRRSEAAHADWNERFDGLARGATPELAERVGPRLGGPPAARPRRGACRPTGRRRSCRLASPAARRWPRSSRSRRRWSAARPT